MSEDEQRYERLCRELKELLREGKEETPEHRYRRIRAGEELSLDRRNQVLWRVF